MSLAKKRVPEAICTLNTNQGSTKQAIVKDLQY